MDRLNPSVLLVTPAFASKPAPRDDRPARLFGAALAFVAAGLLLASVGACRLEQDAGNILSEDAQREMAELQSLWQEAYTARDTNVLSDLLAEDALILSNAQRWTKQGYLSWLKSLPNTGGPELPVLSIDTLRTRLYGDVAIMDGRYGTSPRSAHRVALAAAPVNGSNRFLDVAVLREGRWRFVSKVEMSAYEGPVPEGLRAR